MQQSKTNTSFMKHKFVEVVFKNVTLVNISLAIYYGTNISFAHSPVVTLFVKVPKYLPGTWAGLILSGNFATGIETYRISLLCYSNCLGRMAPGQ